MVSAFFGLFEELSLGCRTWQPRDVEKKQQLSGLLGIFLGYCIFLVVGCFIDVFLKVV